MASLVSQIRETVSDPMPAKLCDNFRLAQILPILRLFPVESQSDSCPLSFTVVRFVAPNSSNSAQSQTGFVSAVNGQISSWRDVEPL